MPLNAGAKASRQYQVQLFIDIFRGDPVSALQLQRKGGEGEGGFVC